MTDEPECELTLLWEKVTELEFNAAVKGLGLNRNMARKQCMRWLLESSEVINIYQSLKQQRPVMESAGQWRH